MNERIASQLQPPLTALRQGLGGSLVSLVLFGSRACGDARPNSDWDLLLLARRLPQKPFQRHLFLKRILSDPWRGRMAILAKTPREFESALPALFLDIALDGLILYDRENYAAEQLTRLQRFTREQGLYREHRGRDLIWQWRKFPGPNWQLTWGMVP